MLTFSGKSNTSIHGLGEDDTLMMGQHWASNMSCLDTSTPCTTGWPWSCLWPYIEARFPPTLCTCYITARHDRNLLRVLSAICIGNLRDGIHIIIPYRATLKKNLFTHLRLCLGTAIHNLKWVKITQICWTWNQPFSNLDVWTHISFLTGVLKSGNNMDYKRL